MKKEIKHYWELIWTFALTDFKLRYQNSFLGYIWAIIKPLLLFTVMYFVFSSVFNFRNNGMENYAVDLLTGLLLFNFFAEVSTVGMGTLLHKANIIAKVSFPKWVLIVASTLNAFFTFIASSLVLFIFIIFSNIELHITSVLLFILFVIITYLLGLAISFLLAPWFVRFRDLMMIWDVIVMMLMYASPIIYPLSLLSENIQKIVLINPLAFSVHFGKQALIYNTYIEPYRLIIVLLLSLGLLGVSYFIFNKISKNIAQHL